MINKNRKFRFTYSTYTDNLIDGSDDKTSSTIVVDINNLPKYKAEDNQSEKQTQYKNSKLQAMAMQAKDNGGSSVSGDYSEYLSKVSPKQHNQITIQCANDKVKELKDKMTDEIKATSGDMTTAEILQETADDHIIYKDYDMEVLEKYIEKIPTMTMLEAMSLKNSLTSEITRFESCKEMLKAVDDLRDNFDNIDHKPDAMEAKAAGTNVDRKIMSANYLDSYGFKESADEFNEIYDKYYPQLNALRDRLTEHIEASREISSSTKYMTNDFLRIIDKKLDNLKTTEPNYEYIKKSLENMKYAFEHRCDYTFLENKLKLFAKHKGHLKSLSKAMTGTFTKVGAKLTSSFSENSLKKLFNALEVIFNHDQYAIISFIYFLDYVTSSEKRSRNDVWVKVLILNVTDIQNNIWDMDEYDSAQYLHLLKDIYCPHVYDISEYLKNRKVKINSQIIARYESIKNYEPTVETEKVENVETEVVETVESTPIDKNNVVEADYIEV